MKRRQISDQVLAWLFDNFLPDDFGLPRQHLFVIRQPGAGKPLCLITAATGRYCWSEDGKRRARLEAAGYRVITVRSAREAEMAIGPKLLAELRQRRADAERPPQRKPSFEIIHGSKSEPHPMRHPEGDRARAA